MRGGDLVQRQNLRRGARDMKAGTTASLFTFLYLREMHEALRGQMNLEHCVGRGDVRTMSARVHPSSLVEPNTYYSMGNDGTDRGLFEFPGWLW